MKVLLFKKHIKPTLLIALLLAGCQGAKPTSNIIRTKPGKLDYASYRKVLNKFVQDGLADYKNLKSNAEDLDSFINSLKCIGPDTSPTRFTSRKNRLAFWINVYNAASLQAAIKRYPCKSVESPWQNFEKSVHVSVDGKSLTLLEIADLARKAGDFDPRIELALTLPAKGSGKLYCDVYQAERIDDQLTQAVKDALNNPKLIHVDHENWSLRLGKPIWRVRDRYISIYRKKFKTQHGTIINALAMYGNAIQRRRINTALGYTVRKIPFDWTLNDASKPKCSLDVD